MDCVHNSLPLFLGFSAFRVHMFVMFCSVSTPRRHRLLFSNVISGTRGFQEHTSRCKQQKSPKRIPTSRELAAGQYHTLTALQRQRRELLGEFVPARSSLPLPRSRFLLDSLDSKAAFAAVLNTRFMTQKCYNWLAVHVLDVNPILPTELVC